MAKSGLMGKSCSIVAVPVLALAFIGCGDDQADETAYCIDQNDQVVQNRYCENVPSGDLGSGYIWFYDTSGSRYHAGSRISRSAGGERIPAGNKAAVTSRGGFGSSARSSGGVGRATAGS